MSPRLTKTRELELYKSRNLDLVRQRAKLAKQIDAVRHELRLTKLDAERLTMTLESTTRSLEDATNKIKIMESNHQLTKGRSKAFEVLNSLNEMRIAASEPELNFWQGKAEQLITEYVTSGTISQATIKSVPRLVQ